jgi:hypothetical protein
MATNMSQEKDIMRVLFDLRHDPFAHGHLHISSSRVRDRIKICAVMRPTCFTTFTTQATICPSNVEDIRITAAYMRRYICKPNGVASQPEAELDGEHDISDDDENSSLPELINDSDSDV